MRRLGLTQDLAGGRLTSLGTPVNPGDGVPKSYLRYDLPFVCSGKPTAGEVFGPLLIPVASTLPANLAGTRVRVRTPPAGPVSLLLKRTPVGSSTATTIATITINSDGSWSLSSQAAITLALDDFIDLVFPATQDANMADVSVTVAVSR